MNHCHDHFRTFLLRWIAFALAFVGNAAIARATVVTPTDDTHVDLESAGPYGGSTELVVKMKRNTSTDQSYNAVSAVMRFQINPTDKATDAALYLDLSRFDEALSCDFRIWGLAEASGSMEDVEEESAKWSNFFGVITNTAVGMNTSAAGVFDGNPATTAKDPLGTITLTQADLNKTVRFSSAALVDFINADSDGVITLIITRVLRSNSFDTAFASKEHTTLSGPRLFIQAEETLGAGADTYARYGDATVHGAESNILVKNNGGTHANTRKGVVRFEMTPGTKVEKATVRLDVANYFQDVGTVPESLNFAVFGIRDGAASESFNEATANDATFSNEIDSSSDGVRNSEVDSLGQFTVKRTDVGKTVSFTSDALVDFINADTNGKITLVLIRAKYTPYLNFAFAAKESTTLEGPRLALTHALDDVPAPTMKFVYQDVDADSVPDLLLVVELPGGNGFVVADPFVIAEALRTAGYNFGVGTDFWETLSVTQQAGLLATVSDLVANVGTTVEAAELDAARQGLPEGRTYAVGTFSGDFESSRYGMTYSGSLLSSSSQNALGYSSVEIGSGQAGAMFTDDGVSLGFESNLVVLTTGVGDPSGTTASLNLSAGVGLYGELKYGKDGQYGFSVPLVVVPVGVSVYVKGSDAVASFNSLKNWVVGWNQSLLTMAYNLHAWQIDWTADVRVGLVDAVNDGRIVISHHAGVAVVWTREAARESTVWLHGTTQEVGSKLNSAAATASTALMSTAENAAAELTNWTSTAGSVVNSTLDSTLGWFEGGVSDLEDLADDVAGGVTDVADDVGEVLCKVFCF
ncbi:hypothetical protein [Polyangium jinanense]|uniref:Uncharacterized protein n=1 Tax=Polyangium jinanense TaxID=2829994 RepID=A0A9X3X866_9BACT|nr:hypothetical protein [Polyangium jinanense]MDC3958893.1 hypothetical protein [Polyangium jinanense]MDC3986007.1 hypothetical protein [Polyangium jinanense]